MVWPKNTKNLWRPLLVLSICLAICYLGYTLLSKNYDSYPAIGDTYDEFKAPFNGISLLKNGYPESWSWYPYYGDFPIVDINNSNFRLVKPWFDEPPLFSYLAGVEAIRKKMETPYQVNIGILRFSMLKIAVLNIFLLFFLVYLNSGLVEAIFAGLIYSTVPTFILSMRLPVSDGMVATFTLLTMLFLTLFLRKKSYTFFVFSLIFSSASLHLKSTGVFVPVALSAILLSQKKYKELLITIISTVISLSLWFWYGYHFGWEIFLKIMQVSSGRELFSPTVIINLFQTFRIGEKPMGFDAWIIWGWISVIIFSFVNKKNTSTFSHLILPVTIGSYLVFFSIMSGHIKGWYRLPFYPFLSWASSFIILRAIRKPTPLSTFFFICLPFFSSYIYGNGGTNWNLAQTKNYQIFMVIIMVFPMLYLLNRNKLLKTISQIIVTALFFISIYYNYRTIVFFQDFFYFHHL